MNEPVIISLPPPDLKGIISLEKAIAERRSLRSFAARPLLLSEISQLLWAASGITEPSRKYRSVPSAGATYPLEFFIVCGARSIQEMSEGIYHYDVTSHSLTRLYPEDVRARLATAALNQESVYQAPLDIVICALYQRTTRYYGSRGEMYVHMEAGHAGQNIYLQATALSLRTVAIGAFSEERVKEALRLEGQYTPLYIMPVGKPD